MFPNVELLLRISLSIMVTNATGERAMFLKTEANQKLLPNYSRLIEHLLLMIMNAEHELQNQLDLSIIILVTGFDLLNFYSAEWT